MANRKLWVFLLAVVALAHGTLAVECEASPRGMLTKCDSSEICRYADLFFGTGGTDGWCYMVVGSTFRALVKRPQEEKALIWYGGWGRTYVDPAFRYCDLYDMRLQDSIRVVVYDVVDFDAFQTPDVIGSYVKEEFANFIRERRDSTVLLATIPLCKGFFPALAKNAGPFAFQLGDLDFVKVGPGSAQLFCAEARESSMGVGAASSSTHQAFWRWDDGNRTYVPIMTSLIDEEFSEFHGARFDADYNFSSDQRIEDIDANGVNELTQKRSFLFGAGPVRSAFSDPGRIVLNYTDGHFEAAQLRLPKRKWLKIHGETPFAILPKWDSAHAKIPQSDEIRGALQLIENGVQNHNILQIPPTSSAIATTKEKELNRVSCSFDVSNDSLSVEVRTVPLGMENQVPREALLKSVLALWFDANLSGDTDSPTCSKDDFLLAIRFNVGEVHTVQTVEKYRVRDSHGVSSLELISQVPSTLNLTGRPPVFQITLPLQECGLVPRDGRPSICGFALEVFDSDTLLRDPQAKARAAYPPNVHRFDPRTWGTLIIADRTDSFIAENQRR